MSQRMDDWSGLPQRNRQARTVERLMQHLRTGTMNGYTTTQWAKRVQSRHSTRCTLRESGTKVSLLSRVFSELAELSASEVPVGDRPVVPQRSR